MEGARIQELYEVGGVYLSPEKQTRQGLSRNPIVICSTRSIHGDSELVGNRFLFDVSNDDN
jgi:hypothetical protein